MIWLERIAMLAVAGEMGWLGFVIACGTMKATILALIALSQ